MKEKKHTDKIFGIISLVVLVGVFYYLSQQFAAEEQYFLTDSIFITPKTQPVYYILLMFVNILLIIFAVYIGFVIVRFLIRLGILFEIVGGFMVIATVILGYVFFFVNKEVETVTDLIGILLLLLFFGGFGVLLLFISLLNKKKRHKK